MIPLPKNVKFSLTMEKRRRELFAHILRTRKEGRYSGYDPGDPVWISLSETGHIRLKMSGFILGKQSYDQVEPDDY